MICLDWPDCACVRRCQTINAALDIMVDEEMPPPLRLDVDEVREHCIEVLECIAQRCPDFCHRYVAHDQLRLEVFACERENAHG
jgi:hypothetical protein